MRQSIATARSLAGKTLALAILLLAACGGNPPPNDAPTVDAGVTPPATTSAPRPSPAVAASPTAAPIATDPSHQATQTPPGCKREEVTRLVERFLDAFNRGDQEQLARFFGPRFEWYSVGDGKRHSLAYNPNGGLRVGGFPAGLEVTVGHQDLLLPYFAQRHAEGERLRLRELSSNYEGVRDIAHITYTLDRTADDLAPAPGAAARETTGKGAIDCRDQTLMVWSMGTR